MKKIRTFKDGQTVKQQHEDAAACVEAVERAITTVQEQQADEKGGR